MPRKLRIQYPGAMYHVMSRGDRREDIFLDDVDRHDFLKTLAEACQKTSWQVHAYCLMRNHYHLVLETPSPNHGNGYLRSACDYLQSNPVRAHLLRPSERLLAYPWSSLGDYLAAPEHRPLWVRVDRLLGEHGLQQDTPAARQEFERRMEARRLQTGDEQGLKALRRGWCLGSEDFRKQMLEKIEDKLGDHHSGELRRETAEAKAERIIGQELGRLGWRETDLLSRPKSDPAKLAIATRLRRETTLPIKTIAAAPHLGTSKSANIRLHAAMSLTAPTQSIQYPRGL